MIANELMIGDWVQDITPVVIDSIGNEYICIYRAEYGYITANLTNLKPIPLTAEILEKNGWKIISNTPNKLEYLWSTGATEEYADVRVLVGKDRNNVLRWDFPALNIHLYRGDIGLTKFKYVHELQHALRLCGIDKEIVL